MTFAVLLVNNFTIGVKQQLSSGQYPEMEFLNGILVEVSQACALSGFLLIFPFYKCYS
jgi:hypothetical protein